MEKDCSDMVDVATNSEFNLFLYQLINYINTGQDSAITSTINGINYTNNAFFDCSLSTLQMTEYLEPVSPDLKDTVIPTCTDTLINVGHRRMQHHHV